ncbi:MAG: hypothetical protein HYT10_02905 [Candidatus Levybacteria bacterium]|nr:hypothetical protein [Candidatus Levybacteria bacterium]
MKPELALPAPAENVQSRSAHIDDSVSLTKYLLEYVLGEPPQQLTFANQLDLEILSPVVDTLYQNYQDVHVLDESIRQEEAAHIDEMAKLGVTVNPDFSIKAPGERSLSVYYDPTDKGLFYTAPKLGEYNEVTSDIGELLEARKIPLIAAHTHPLDELPSPKDFLPIIANLGNNMRLVSAILVVCESVQVLAIATPSTPRIELNEVDSFLSAWDTYIRSIDKDKMDRASNHLETVDAEGITIAKKVLDKARTQINQATEAEKNGHISQGELETITTLATLQRRIDMQVTKQQHYERTLQAVEELLSVEKGAINQGLLELARELQVKMYISSNGKDFFEFAA